MNNYYVYVHRIPETNEIFYVGKGRGYRYSTRSGRNKFWHNIVNKYGFTYEIVLSNLTEIQSLEIEQDFIKFYGRSNNQTGRLVNATDGGEGLSGIKSPRSDKRKYKFYNIFTDESVICTKVEFKEKLGKIRYSTLFNDRGCTKSGWIAYDYFDWSNLDAAKSKRKGGFSNRTENEKYRIINVFSLEELYITKFSMVNDFNINAYDVLKGKSHKGWVTYEEFNKYGAEYLIKRINKILEPYNLDKTSYCFRNKNSGEVFNGTRKDFTNKYGIDVSHLFSKSKRPCKSRKGWIIDKGDTHDNNVRN